MHNALAFELEEEDVLMRTGTLAKRRFMWLLAITPMVIAAVRVVEALREGVSPRHLAGLLGIATVAGGIYLAVRWGISKAIGRNKWIPLLFDIAFAFAFIAFLWWLENAGQ